MPFFYVFSGCKNEQKTWFNNKESIYLDFVKQKFIFSIVRTITGFYSMEIYYILSHYRNIEREYTNKTFYLSSRCLKLGQSLISYFLSKSVVWLFKT